MKLSLGLPDDEGSPLFKAKLPISIFNQPFTSIFTSTTTSIGPDSTSDISFSLATNFSSGPSIRLNYSPSSSASSNLSSFPLSLSLKSGLGVFGSPKNSPLTFSANFFVSKSSPSTIIPTFSLHFKPHLGQFSLRKRSASSSSSFSSFNPDQETNFGPHVSADANGSASSSELGNGSGSDGTSGWQELKLEPLNGKEKDGSVSCSFNHVDGAYGVGYGSGPVQDGKLTWSDEKKRVPCTGTGASIIARTELPLIKGVLVSFRWGVNMPGCFGTKLPYLTVSKIALETVVEAKEEKKVKGMGDSSKEGDLELLNGLCFWMRRDLELLERENREMKRSLEDMRVENWENNARGPSNIVGKKGAPGSSTSSSVGEFEQWRTNKSNREESGRRESRKPASQMTDLQSELQKAIKAASS